MQRRLIGLVLAYALATLVSACAPRPLPEIRVEHPIDEIDILEALFRSAAAPIATDPFCAGIAAPDTRTIGRFVAGLLAAHERGRKNWVQVSTFDENPPNWAEEALFVHGDNEDALIWGIRFEIRSGDRSIDKTSFRCLTHWFQ